MIQLRPYQAELTDKARVNIREGVKAQVLVAPTGAGKGELACFMQGGMASRGIVSWFSVHRDTILDGQIKKCRRAGIDFGVVAKGYPFEPEKPVQLGMVQTLVNRMHLLPKPGGIVQDEAHHTVASTHSALVEANPDAWLLGVTATPERLDGKGLRKYYSRMVVGPTPRRLIDDGYLAPFRYYAPGEPDLAGGRDGLNRGDTSEIMGDAKLIGDAVDAWGAHAVGMRTINFELSVKASLATVAAFKTSGIEAAHVDGTMHRDQIMELFRAFEVGEIMFLSNCMLMGEGTDVPGIECVMLRDPGDSLTKFMQECGRAGRPMYADGFDMETVEGRLGAMAAGPKPHAVILDMAGNAFRHGLPDADRTWSLDGRRDREKQQRVSDAIPIRTCPLCYRITPSTVKVCPGCEYEHATFWTPPQWKDGDLYELKQQGIADREAAKQAAAAKRKVEERQCGNDLAAWIRLGVTRGYKSPRGWALNQIKIRGDYAAKFRRRG